MENLIKALEAFHHTYKHKGISSLIDCESQPEFHNLFSKLDQISYQDAGINPAQLEAYFKENTVTYIKVFDAAGVSVEMFCIPKGISFKLHDHPEMLVLTKILFGKVSHRSLDLVDKSFQKDSRNALFVDDSDLSNNLRLEAVFHAEKVLKANDITYLTPEKGNIHSISAQEDTILMDVFLPSYNERSCCNYYKELPSNSQEESSKPERHFEPHNKNISSECEFEPSNNEENVILTPITPPYDTRIRMVMYQGEPLNYNFQDKGL